MSSQQLYIHGVLIIGTRRHHLCRHAAVQKLREQAGGRHHRLHCQAALHKLLELAGGQVHVGHLHPQE